MADERSSNGTPSEEDPVQLVDALLAEVQATRARWEELERMLDSAPQGAGEPAGGGPAAEDEDPAKLMALELARSGRSREEVEQYLKQTFGLQADPALLDAVFADQS